MDLDNTKTTQPGENLKCLKKRWRDRDLSPSGAVPVTCHLWLDWTGDLPSDVPTGVFGGKQSWKSYISKPI